MISLIWHEKHLNLVEKVFTTYVDFIAFLKKNIEINQVLNTTNKKVFINKNIQHAFINFKEGKNSHTFYTKKKLTDYLNKNATLAEAIGFNAINKKRGEIKVELNDFSARLKQSMGREQLSQTALSKLIGTSQPEVSHYLKSKALPRPYILQRLALVLNVSYYWLRSGEGKMEVKSPYPLDEFWTSLNERIVFLFMINNIKPKDLEGTIGKWTSLISAWCDGIRKPTDEQIITLANYFNIDIIWLRGNYSHNHPKALKKYHALLDKRKLP